MPTGARTLPYKDPAKRRERQRIYSKAYYERNKDHVKARAKRTNATAKARWRAYKATLSCSHCGIKHPVLIDFHHVDKSPPKRAVNKLASDRRYAAALEEVKKCIPLCANCHRLLHHEERVQQKASRKRKK